jgi:hypothetical protein
METSLLLNLSTPVLGIAVVLAITLLALAGLALVRRSVALSTLESHHEVAGFILALVGVVYAVLLAFVVIAVWEQFEDAKSGADREAAMVGSLYRDALVLDANGPLPRATEAYARSVVDREFPAMEEDHRDSPATDIALNRTWRALRSVRPGRGGGAAFYEQSVSDLHDVTEVRSTRIQSSGAQLPGPMWAVLLVGAAIVIGSTYFFGVANFRAQALMVGSLASIVGLVLFLILALDLPFTGDVGVSSSAMEDTIEEFPAARSGA